MQTVLVIDDEPGVLQVVSRMLARLGYRAVTAASGAEAVDLYRAQADEIDCAIIDLTMAEMDGMATLAALREVREDVCAILASGYDEAEVEDRYGDSGFAGFIQKPFTLAGLKDKLDGGLRPGRPRNGLT